MAVFPESVFGSRAINMPTTAGEMLQRQDPIAVGQMAELANIVSGKDGASNVARQFNVNQQDPRFKAGELTTDIGAAFAVPASLGAIASKIPQAAKYAQALRTGGFDLGPAATKSKLANILMKGGAGVGTNVATAQLTNPEDLDSAIAFGLLPAGLETAATGARGGRGGSGRRGGSGARGRGRGGAGRVSFPRLQGTCGAKSFPCPCPSLVADPLSPSPSPSASPHRDCASGAT
jgi:hypothetical protein